MKSVKDLNWAWQYWSEVENKWLQFDCIDCLSLEFSFKAYHISGNSTFRLIEILQGTVDLDTLEMKPIGLPS